MYRRYSNVLSDRTERDEDLTKALREEVKPFGVKVLAVEPGAFRTSAYAGFADETTDDDLDAYQPMLTRLRATMIEQDGEQPGDPVRGVQAVLDAMDRADPPENLVLGGRGYQAVTARLEGLLAQVRADKDVALNADFPAGD